MRAWHALLGGLLLLWMALAQAGAVRVSDSETFQPLAGDVAVFEDAGAGMGIEEVVAHAAFSVQPEKLRPGFTPSAIWLKAELINPTPAPLLRWLSLGPAALREASFYVRRDGRWQRLDAGIARPFAAWPIAATATVFPLPLAAQAQETVYVRVASPVPLMIAPALWEPAAFRERESHFRLLDGLMLGGLAVMALVGVLLVFMMRDRAFVFNALATVSYCLGEASAKGYSFMYLWPEATDWGVRCLPLFAAFGVGMNILFVRDLLLTRRDYPRLDKLLWGLLAVQWLPALGILFGDLTTWARVSFALIPPATGVALLIGGYATLKGNYAARYYTAAYALLGTGSLLHALTLGGVLVPEWHGEYALPLGMLLSNALMMVSVVYRIMQVRQENETAQAALLAERASREAQLEQEVSERTAALEDANSKLEELVVTDGLTGLANRRRFDEALATEWARACRSGRPVGVIMLDVDYFKNYNDHYGHQAGDECLKTVARVLQTSMRRAGEFAARYGGEEFVAVVTDPRNGNVAAFAEAVRQAIEDCAIPHEVSPFGKITVSAGVAVMTPDEGLAASEVLTRADEALYRAKEGGRNRVAG